MRDIILMRLAHLNLLGHGHDPFVIQHCNGFRRHFESPLPAGAVGGSILVPLLRRLMRGAEILAICCSF